MSPTYEAGQRFKREYLELPRAQRRAFNATRTRLVEALGERPPRFPLVLRVHWVQGDEGVWELTWAPDGGATFSYGSEVRPGEPHVVWRRIGDHSILREP